MRRLEGKYKEILNDHLGQFEKKRKEELTSEIASYKEMKNETFKDVSFLTILKSNMQNMQNMKSEDYSNACMIGFCISNKVNISSGTGYYATNKSFMFYIGNNPFYNKVPLISMHTFVKLQELVIFIQFSSIQKLNA